MPRQYYMQTTFNGGELSPRLKGRVDVERYKNSCETLENFLLYPHGAAKSRPGFRFVAEAKYPTRECRLIRFTFSDTQAYILEFGHLYIRVFKDQGAVTSDGVTPYEITTTYDEDDLWGIQCAQSSDVLYLVHPDYPPRKLTRLDHDDWTLADVDWTDGPYLTENIDGVTCLTCSAKTGSNITVTASGGELSGEGGEGTSTSGTWSMDGIGATIGAGPPGFTASPYIYAANHKYHVFLFTAPSASALSSVVFDLVEAAGSTDHCTCYLYDWNSGDKKVSGSALATSDEKDWNTTGEVTHTFAAPYTMTAGTTYALVWYLEDIATSCRIDWTYDHADASYQSVILGIDDLASAFSEIGSTATHVPRIKLNIGTASTTGSDGFFQSCHVGSMWRVRHAGNSTYVTMNSLGDMSSQMQIRGKFYVDMSPDNDWIGRVVLQKSYNRSVWYDVASFHYSTKQEFEEVDTGVYYRVQCVDRVDGTVRVTIAQEVRWGVFRVTSLISGTQVHAEVLVDIPTTDPTTFWCEGAWSACRGYPKTICFNQERLCLASTEHQPYTMWGSWVGDYENFTPSDTDNAPLEFTLSALNNRIQWMVSGSTLILGSTGEEAQVAAVKAGAITQTNFDVRVHSTIGSAGEVAPIRVGSAILFLQRARKKLMELTYSLESDSFVPVDLTLFAEHLTSEYGIKALAYQQEPDSVIWCVRDDGVLLGLTYYRKENVIGWSRHITDGTFESVETIPSSMGATAGRDELWVVVNRYVGGDPVRFIELLEDHESVSSDMDKVCLDCSLTYSGDATATITGMTHLVGEEVYAAADGFVSGPHTVSDAGVVTLDSPASKVHLGLPYTCTLRSVSPEAGAGDGTSQGRTRRMSKIVVRFLDSLYGMLGVSDTELEEIPFLTPDLSLLEVAPGLVTGDYDVTWGGDWTTDNISPFVVQDKPFPMTVLAQIMVVHCND